MSVTASRDLTLYGHRLLRRISLPGEPTKWRCQCLNCGAEYNRHATQLYRQHSCDVAAVASEARIMAPRREPKRATRTRPSRLCACGKPLPKWKIKHCSEECLRVAYMANKQERRERRARLRAETATAERMASWIERHSTPQTKAPIGITCSDMHDGEVVGWLVPVGQAGQSGPEPWRHVAGGALTADEKADMGPYRPERAQVAS